MIEKIYAIELPNFLINYPHMVGIILDRTRQTSKSFYYLAMSELNIEQQLVKNEHVFKLCYNPKYYHKLICLFADDDVLIKLDDIMYEMNYHNIENHIYEGKHGNFIFCDSIINKIKNIIFK